MKLRLSILGVLFFLSSGAQAAAPAVAKWNVLFYLNGKNSLQKEMQDFVLKKLYRMQDVEDDLRGPLELPSNVNILVEYGTLKANCDERSYEERDLDLCVSGVKRFRMIKGVDQVTEPDSAFEDLGRVDMGSANSLVDFVAWSKKFPANKTVLYIFNHGSHFTSSDEGLFSFDEEMKSSMNAREIAEGFQKMARVLGRPIDLFITDMCLVGSAEALGQMQGALRFYVASRENLPGYALNVIDILRNLERLPDLNAKRWAYQVVLQASKSSNNTNFSAFNLEAAPAFEQALGDLVDAIRAQPVADQIAFQSHFLNQCRFPEIDSPHSFEFRDVLHCFGTMPGMREWPEYEALHSAFFALMYTNSSNMNESGLSIWGGYNRKARASAQALEDYRSLEFDQGSHWSDLIELLGRGR